MNLWSSAALVIGAGENAEIAAKYLVKEGVGSLVIANRSKDNAEALCKRLGTGTCIALDDVPRALKDFDLVIASTGATEPVVAYESMNGTLKERTRPLLMIDIAVPRDIDERIGQFDCVTIVNIDDLDRRIAGNKEKRSSVVPEAKKIVDDFTDNFAHWLESLSVVPVVAQLTQKALELARAEAKRYAKDFGEGNTEKLEMFAESLARKLVHGPVSFIKATDPDDPTTQQLHSLDLVNKMFLLDDEDKEG
jgi:glutamyl-tRNA reductase